MKKIKDFIGNTFIRKWFLTLLAFVAFLFLSFMIYTRINSTKALQLEYTSYSELETERVAEQLDENFRSYTRITALLSLNSTIRIYLFNENADSVFTSIHDQVANQLIAYKEGFPAIDSIYLFPASGDEFFRSGENIPTSYANLVDKTCLVKEDSPATLTLVPREKNGKYPYLMTIYLPLYEGEKKGMIVLNIDFQKIPLLKESAVNSFQQIYIISDDEQLLYHYEQRNIPEPLNLVPQLQHYDNEHEFYSQYIHEKTPYIYVQYHSQRYPWSYVTITTPQSYIGRSFDFYTSLWNFLPWLLLLALLIIVWLVLLATHPIRTITDFLDNPLLELPDNITEPQTRKIIRQFINYIQANHSLSVEIEKQLELQNKATYCALQTQINPHFLFNTLNLIRSIEIQALGYNHEAPELTLSLSRLMQYALDSVNLVPLKTEFYYTSLYLRILNQRYQNKIHFNISKEDSVSEILVPKLILQPLIENAVFHGLSPTIDTCNTVLIEAISLKDICKISIKDNGIGIKPEQLHDLQKKLSDYEKIPSDSIGLQNVALRMHLTYGDAFTIGIKSLPNNGTCITLTFPTSIQ